MFDRRTVLAASLCFGAAGSNPATAEGPTSHRAVATALNAILRGARSAGGFVAAARNGHLLAFHGWGRASHAFDQPVTTRTMFHLGSNGKLFTGLAVRQLVESGGVRVEAPISAYLSGLPAAWAGVTVGHLLHQTSGLPDYLGPDTAWDRPLDRAAFLALLTPMPVLFSPGSAWAYSNTNYLLLGWLVEDVSKLAYSDYVARKLLKPAATPLARPDAAETVIAGRAEPYNYVDGALRHAVRMQNEISSLPDGGVLFSASDLAPWQAALAGARLVSREGLRAVRSPGRLRTGRAVPYGYGQYLDRTRGHLFTWHAGYVPGFPSYSMTFPDSGLSVLACTNSDGPGGANLPALALATAEALAPGSTYASLPLGTLADERAHSISTFLFRGDAAPEAGLLAPELAVLDPATLNRAAGPLVPVVPVERYRVLGGEMVRYRLGGPDLPRYRLAGWTDQGKLFWINN